MVPEHYWGITTNFNCAFVFGVDADEKYTLLFWMLTPRTKVGYIVFTHLIMCDYPYFRLLLGGQHPLFTSNTVALFGLLLVRM